MGLEQGCGRTTRDAIAAKAGRAEQFDRTGQLRGDRLEPCGDRLRVEAQVAGIGGETGPHEATTERLDRAPELDRGRRIDPGAMEADVELDQRLGLDLAGAQPRSERLGDRPRVDG